MNRDTPTGIGIAAVVLGLSVFLWSSCSTDDAEPAKAEVTPAPTEEPSTAFKLAALDEQSHPDQRLVGEYEVALSSLDRRCPEDEGLVADMAVRSTQQLEERGVKQSTLQVMRGVLRAMPEDGDVGACADLFGAYVVLETS